MEYYFSSLLSKQNEPTTYNVETFTLDEDEMKEIKDEQTNETKDDSNEIITNKPHAPIIVYSFLSHSLIEPLQQLHIYDLTDDLKRIIRKEHVILENKFTTNDELNQKINASLLELVTSKLSEHQVFLLSPVPESSPFNLTLFFQSPRTERPIKHPRFRSLFINSSFPLLLSQMLADYKSEPYRTTLNRDATYLLTNYSSASSSSPSTISYSLDELNSALDKVKSAFTSKDDYQSFISLFEKSFTSSNLLFNHISSFTKTFNLSDTSSSSLTQLIKSIEDVDLSPP